MRDQPRDLDPYLAARLREALAQDPRIGELGVRVEITGTTVVLSGNVTSAERQETASEIARQMAPHHDVLNETTVEEFDEPALEEHLP